MLSQQQQQLFEDQGYLVLPAQAEPEFCQQVLNLAQASLNQQVQPIEYEADTAYPGAPSSREAEGGMTARRLLQAYARDPMLATWATGPKVKPAILSLLGAGAKLVQAHHNCIMTKQARYSSLTGWHRDSRYWHFQRPALVSCWLALRDENVENGCLWVLPGSHKTGLSPEQLDTAQFLREDLPENQHWLKQKLAVPLRQGDVLLFHSNLFHAAGKNLTNDTKFSLVFTYRSDDNPAVPGSRSAARAEIELTSD